MSSGGSSSSSARAPAAPSLPQLASSARDALSSRLKPMGGKLSRPRRRVASRRGASYVEASAVAAPAATGVLGELSSVFPLADVLAGGAARAASQSTIHPLDTIKVRMQAALKGVTKTPAAASAPSAAAPTPTTVSTGKYGIGVAQLGAASRGTPRAVAVAAGATLGKVGAEVGSLYKGVVGAASGAGIAIAAYFAFYGAAKRLLERHSEYSVSTIAFVAGGIGALGSSVVKVPAAVCIRSVQANVYPNVVVAARRITRAAGPRGLFTGYLPTLLEDVPDMAVKFAAYETMRTAHRKLVGMKQDDSAAAADITMGLIAGAVAAGATTPLDVVKTRMMCNASARPSFAGAVAGVWRDSPPGVARVKTFFTGVGPRAFSNGINSAIFFCFFEQLRVVFRAQEQRAAIRRLEAREAEAAREKVSAHGSSRYVASSRGGTPGRDVARRDAVDAVYTNPDRRQMRVTEASVTRAMIAKNAKARSDTTK